MEDNYSNMWSQEVDMDLDMGVGVSEVEEAIVDFNENVEVDCSESFQSSEVNILFSSLL